MRSSSAARTKNRRAVGSSAVDDHKAWPTCRATPGSPTSHTAQMRLIIFSSSGSRFWNGAFPLTLWRVLDLSSEALYYHRYSRYRLGGCPPSPFQVAPRSFHVHYFPVINFLSCALISCSFFWHRQWLFFAPAAATRYCCCRRPCVCRCFYFLL